MSQAMRVLFALALLAAPLAFVSSATPAYAGVEDEDDRDEELNEEREYERFLERLAKRD